MGTSFQLPHAFELRAVSGFAYSTICTQPRRHDCNKSLFREMLGGLQTKIKCVRIVVAFKSFVLVLVICIVLGAQKADRRTQNESLVANSSRGKMKTTAKKTMKMNASWIKHQAVGMSALVLRALSTERRRRKRRNENKTKKWKEKRKKMTQPMTKQLSHPCRLFFERLRSHPRPFQSISIFRRWKMRQKCVFAIAFCIHPNTMPYSLHWTCKMCEMSESKRKILNAS